MIDQQVLKETAFQELFQNTGDAVIIFKEETSEILNANPSFCSQFGFEADDIIGLKEDEILMPPYKNGCRQKKTDYKFLISHSNLAEDYQNSSGVCCRIIECSGIHHLVEVSSSFISYMNCQAKMIFIRKIQTESSEEFFHQDDLIFSAFQDVEDIAVVNLEFFKESLLISDVNCGAENKFNYRKRELKGKSFDSIAEYNLYSKMLYHSSIPSRNEKGFSGEFIFIKKSQEKFLAHVVVNFIRNKTGNVFRILCVITDISELKKNEKDFILARNQLEEKIWMRTLALNDINQTLKKEVLNRRKSELLMNERKKVLEMLVSDVPLERILLAVAETSKIYNSEMICFILLYDAEKSVLEFVYQPDIPEELISCFHQKSIHEEKNPVNECAVHARRVVVENILEDRSWNSFREKASRNHISASIAEPILSRTGELLGIFSVLFTRKKNPAQADIEFA
ncbi:MAG: PAS domain S-box protein, partial [Spirochaetia bacterium]|nr:PAS domain S-box protein [Spirochaetia bacterium]